MRIVFFINISCFLTSFLRHSAQANHTRKEADIEGYNERSKREGHLTCTTFGSSGCKLVCEVFCDLYGCESHGFCVGKTCLCRERYDIFSKKFDAAQYQQISSNILWYYKFGTNTISHKVFISLQQTFEVWEAIQPLLRNPSQTGYDIKCEILALRPDWHVVHDLQPVRHGYCEDFIKANVNPYDDDHFPQYIDMVVDYITDKYYYAGRGLAPGEVRPPRPPWPPSEKTESARYLYKLISLCQNPWMLNYMEDFVRRKRYNDKALLDYLDPKRRRNILSGTSILNVLLLAVVDHLMDYERGYEKGEQPGSQKHTFYYILSKRQIDELNDFDFDDFEEQQKQH